MATKDRTALKNDFANGKYATGEKFADLIDSMKVVQLPVVDPQALGTSLSFIDSISQDADGKITATKKTLDLANAHELNPFKGWYKTGDTLPTDGFDGAYLYFKDTSELTGQTTIYRWNGTTYADTGTVVDTSNVNTFETGQAVNGVAIDDTHLANPAANALAKAGDVMQLAAKLEGVTANKAKATYSAISGKKVSGTGELLDLDTASYTTIELGDATHVDFMGLNLTSSAGDTSRNTGYCFGHYEGEELEENWVIDAAYPYDATESGSSNVLQLYYKEVPQGVTHLRTNVTYGSVLVIGTFYCYKYFGKSVVDLIPQVVDNLTTDDPIKALSANQGKVLNIFENDINTYEHNYTEEINDGLSYRNQRVMDENGISIDSNNSNAHLLFFNPKVVFEKGTVLTITCENIYTSNLIVRIAMFDESIANINIGSHSSISGTYEQFTATAQTETTYTYTCEQRGLVALQGTRLGTKINIEIKAESFITIKQKLEELNDAFFSTKITSLNPSSEWLPKFLSAKRGYYSSTFTDAPKPLVIAHISDIHGGWENVQRFIDFTNQYNNYIDILINTGDLVNYYGDSISDYTSIVGSDKILNVIGNHETRVDTNWHGATSLEVYNKFIAPFVSTWGVEQPDGAATYGYCYYYKDFTSQKIRIIVVDIMNYDTTQNSWLQGVLADAITNNMYVLIATHFAGNPNDADDIEGAIDGYKDYVMGIIPCRYSTVGINRAGTGPAADGKLDLYSPTGYTMRDSVQAFVDAGGVFIGYLTGHYHYEIYAQAMDYPNQKIYAAESALNTPRRDYDHVTGTRFQDGFNIVSIDPTPKDAQGNPVSSHPASIKIYKVGANIDAYGREKNCTTIIYSIDDATESIISEY